MRTHVFSVWVPGYPAREVEARDRDEARRKGARLLGTLVEETLVRYSHTVDRTGAELGENKGPRLERLAR